MKNIEMMMHRTLLLFILLLTGTVIHGAEYQIKGVVADRSTREAMSFASVRLLKSDSTFVAGTLTDDEGGFLLTAPDKGTYLLQLSVIGYTTVTQRVELSKEGVTDLGTVAMRADAVMLKETTVTGRAAKVTLKQDTFIYNSAAYRTPEGSTVEELVKRLPGAQVDDDGKITINGKEVKKVLIDGKEFMTGDTKTAMKNLPTSIVDRIKAYDQQSDLSRVTGIDDGEEEMVLDFGLKKGMNKGVFSNVDVSAGTHSRYAERLMGAYFNQDSRVMLFGNANNTNDMGFPGGGGRGRFGASREGLNAAKMLGANFNYEKKDRLKVDGSVRWNHSNSDIMAKTSSENFVSTVGSFSNALKQDYGRTNQWNAQMKLEWMPDTLTNITFRPTASYSYNDGRATSMSATYNDDPFNYTETPLEQESIAQMASQGLMVNTRSAASISYANSKQLSGMLQYNRRLNALGRNITFRTEGRYGQNNSRNVSVNNVHLYLVEDQWGQDSVYQTNRYTQTPVRNWAYSLQSTYSEPLFRSTYLQFSYKYTYSYSKSDRSTYDFSNLGASFFTGVVPVYRGWNGYLGLLDSPLESYYDDQLSRFSEYKNYTHEAQVMFRMNRKSYKLNAGIMLQPQRSHFIQNYRGISVDTIRNVVDFAPTLNFRYKFSDISTLRINYRGTSQQPAMTDLLDIIDDSDPMNITRGNPGLKPAFVHSLRLFYNTYIPQHQRAIMTFFNYTNTRNGIGQSVTYDAETGSRTIRPENMNGNWNATGAVMFNTAIDSTGYWNVNTFTNANYNNYVGRLSTSPLLSAEKNVTRTLNLGERLGVNYRNSWLEAEIDGSFNYMRSRNKLQQQSNLNTWQFAYGGTLNLTAPWGTTLSTDVHMNSRRGYNDNSLNTNELVWNAQVAQSFLRQRNLTASVQLFDILHKQSNISRTVNVLQRSDTEYNSINSYAMVHVIYRLNLFGTKEAREGMRDMDRPPMDGRGMGDRRGMGGMGGNRQPRGGGFGRPM